MKRKAENIVSTESKFPALSSFLKEEILPIDGINEDVETFLVVYNDFLKDLTEKMNSNEKVNIMELSKYILKLKELNRKSQYRIHLSREKTKETKDDVNKNHLIMQNLVYEALHLHNETTNCLEFKSLHEQIDLIPIQKFQQEASTNYLQYSTEHEQTINRLYWELEERKKLFQEIKEAEETEEKLCVEINKKRRNYEDIVDNLNGLLEVAKPLEEIFGIPSQDEEDIENEMLRKLDEHLYTIYVQLKVLMMMRGSDEGECEEWRPQNVVIVDNLNIKSVHKICNYLITTTFSKSSNIGLVFAAISCCAAPNDDDDDNQVQKILFNSKSILQELDQLSSKFNDLTDELVKFHNNTNSLADFAQTWCCNCFQNVTDIQSVMRHLQIIIKRRHSIYLQISHLFHQYPHCQLSSFNQYTQLNNNNSRFLRCQMATSTSFYLRIDVKDNQDSPWLTIWIIVPINWHVTDRAAFITLQCVSGATHLEPVLQMMETEVNLFSEEAQFSGSQNEDAEGEKIILKQVDKTMNAIKYLSGNLNKRKMDSILIGGKFPASKRPFLSQAGSEGDGVGDADASK